MAGSFMNRADRREHSGQFKCGAYGHQLPMLSRQIGPVSAVYQQTQHWIQAGCFEISRSPAEKLGFQGVGAFGRSGNPGGGASDASLRDRLWARMPGKLPDSISRLRHPGHLERKSRTVAGSRTPMLCTELVALQGASSAVGNEPATKPPANGKISCRRSFG